MTSARRIVSEQGVRGLAFRLAQIALRPPWGHVEWFHVVETAPNRALDPLRPVWVTDPEMAASRERAGFGPPIEVVRRRLAQGSRTAVARDDGIVLAYAWVHGTAEYDEEGVVFRLRPREAWVFDGAVHPEHRGRRIYPRLVLGMTEDLAAEGKTRILSTIDARNRASLRQSDARGSRRLGSVVMLRLLGGSVVRVQWMGARPAWRAFRGATRLTVPA